MHPTRHAILAVCGASMLMLALGPLKHPLKVRFQLTEGVRIGGALSSRQLGSVVGSIEQSAGEHSAGASQLNTTAPEGKDWPADPWPALSATEQAAAVLTMRAQAERITKQTGVAAVVLETDHFLLSTDCPRAEGAKWIMQLERMHDLLNLFLNRGRKNGVDSKLAPIVPWGKIAVFVFAEQDRFQHVEAESFNQLVPEATIGICHCIGPKAFVNLHRHEDGELFEWTMLHEAVHALMHRYRTPRRLPAWANEGIAEHLVALLLPDSPVASQRRAQGLQFIRGGGDVSMLFRMNYGDQTWPGPNAIGLPIGALMIELIAKDQPRRVLDWINAVKDGAEWPAALQKHLGVDQTELEVTMAQYYKVND